MDELEQKVLAAKADEQIFNELVESHKTWMLRVAHETTHRYITDSDDEWSIALMAFSEAVQSYEADKGSFRGLAAMVIRRRIVDYLRTEGRHADEFSVTPAAFEGGLNEEEAGGINLQPQMEAAVEHFTPVSGTESSVPADTQPVEPPTQETPQQETNREPTNPPRNDAPHEQREVLPAQQNDQPDMQEQPQIEERPNTDESQPSWESGQPLEQEQPQRGEEMQEQPQQGNDRQEQIPQGNEQPQETDQTGNAPSPFGDQPEMQDGDIGAPPDSGNGPMTFAPHGDMRNSGEHGVHGRKNMGPDGGAGRHGSL